MASHTKTETTPGTGIDCAIIVTDLHGIVTDWSVGAEALFGWTREEIVGASVARIWTAEDIAAGRLEEEMRRACADGRAGGGRWQCRKDGGRFWASSEVTPLRRENGGHRGYVKVVHDRTHQLETEASLRQSEGRFKTLIETMETAFAIVEANTMPKTGPSTTASSRPTPPSSDKPASTCAENG